MRPQPRRRSSAFTSQLDRAGKSAKARSACRLLLVEGMKHLALVGLSLMACTSHGASEFDQVASELEGIYQVQSYTRNEQACSPGGEDRLGDDRFAAAFTGEVFGIQFLEVVSCASPADCRDKVAAARSNQAYQLEFSFTVSELGANGELLGGGASTGFADNGVCRDAEITATTLVLADSALRLEQAITVAPDFPTADGVCSTRAAQDAAADRTCSELEVLTATFFESL